MGVLSVLSHGAVVTGCGFAFFWLNRKLLSYIVPVKARHSSKQIWRWINIANSFTHSCITGIGASYCMVVTPMVWQDLINGYSEVAYLLSAFSVGYLHHFVQFSSLDDDQDLMDLLKSISLE